MSEPYWICCGDKNPDHNDKCMEARMGFPHHCRYGTSEEHSERETKRLADLSFVKTKTEKHSIEITERWIPSLPGERVDVMFGNWQEGFKPMKLEGRYVNGKRI